ncbi:hypothetical protein AA14337_0603 [Acetobacter malorum DSM 14337]|uniref:Tetratricopeptide repeat family protein n=2 Tax=Acetobacter malorum TaxID=178901 RepID=A0ABQ0PNM7_9PROT|nr:hypothetical protein AA14337_0603 [Acetobacter malorum DSM 14337]
MRRIAACLVLTQGLAPQAGLLAPRAVFAAPGGVDGLHAAPVQPVLHDGLNPQEGDASHASLFLPFDAQTGVAAFWSGPDFVVVADRPVPALAHASGGSGLFSSLDVTVLDTATLIRLHLPSHPQLSLSHQSDGWVLQGDTSARSGSSSGMTSHVAQVFRPGAVLFPQKQPGRIIALPDPASGGRLLIAPSRVASGGIAQGRQGVGYGVRPSLEGVVIAADSRQITLRSTAEGAVLDAVALHPLPVGQAPDTAQTDTHGQDWDWLGLSHAGNSSKPSTRLAAAQAAFAAGQPWQALKSLEEASPQGEAAADEKIQTAQTFLQAAASLLTGRIWQAQVLNGAQFGDAPATRIWRGLYLMQTGQNSRNTSILLSAGFAQLQAYPAPVRALILPQVATYVVRFGDVAAVNLLGTLPDDTAYDLARALLEARAGQTETARVALENLTASSSSQITAYARAALVAVMLDKDMIGPSMAAEAYGKLLDNDGQPAALPAGPKATIRLGQAHALTLAGQPQAALAVLDSVRAGPDAPQDVLAAAYQATLKALIFPEAASKAVTPQVANSAPLSATARFALVASHLRFVEEGAGKAKLLLGYGRQLLEAGQPDAAATAFAQAAAMLADPVARAEAEDLLAQAGLQAHRPALVQRALERATAPGMPDDLATQRAYDAARLAAESGDTAKALTLLAQDETDAGLDLRGKLYESEKRWPEAVLVIGRLATRGLPEEGVLTEPQRALALRLASDAAAAGDSETLLRLKGWLAGRTLGRERDALLAMQIRSIKPHSPAH